MAQVERDGVASKEPPHEGGKRGPCWPEQKMEMVRHQRPRQAVNIHLQQKLLKPIPEVPPIIIREKDVAALYAANDHVLQKIRNVNSR